MNNQKNKFLLLLLLITWPCVSMSEPSPEISNLMKDPISMLDFGIYKIDKLLRSELKLPSKTYLTVSYNWDKNLIDVQIYNAAYKPLVQPSENTYKRKCDNLISDIKIELGYNPHTGKSIFTDEQEHAQLSVIPEYFSHSGFYRKSSKEGWKEVEKIIKITAKLKIQKLKGESKAEPPISCFSNLKSTQIFYSR